MDKILIRFDGIQQELYENEDNLCFTFLSSFVGVDGRDYLKSSWIGIQGVLRTGVKLDSIQIVLKENKGLTTAVIPVTLKHEKLSESKGA